MPIEQPIELGAVAPREPGRLGHVALSNLENASQVIPLEGSPSLTEPPLVMPLLA